ncbi:hypothetical protein DIPPA_18295 [Diplonema papillatum]|nr:hypothetical protein DIPPA_18295 [Diplonema papillatum]KAJ9464907.1 hypothetical protein DIPPA_18295 [Diplonema papillatum]
MASNGLHDSADALLQSCREAEVANEKLLQRRRQLLECDAAVQEELKQRKESIQRRGVEIQAIRASRATVRDRCQELATCRDGYRRHQAEIDAAGREMSVAVDDARTSGAAVVAGLCRTEGLIRFWAELAGAEKAAGAGLQAATDRRNRALWTLHHAQLKKVATQYSPRVAAAEKYSQALANQVAADRQRWKRAVTQSDQEDLEGTRVVAAAALNEVEGNTAADGERKWAAAVQEAMLKKETMGVECKKDRDTEHGAELDEEDEERAISAEEASVLEEKARREEQVAALLAEQTAAQAEVEELQQVEHEKRHAADVKVLLELDSRFGQEQQALADGTEVNDRARAYKAMHEKEALEKEHQARVVDADVMRKREMNKSSQAIADREVAELHNKLTTVLEKRMLAEFQNGVLVLGKARDAERARLDIEHVEAVRRITANAVPSGIVPVFVDQNSRDSYTEDDRQDSRANRKNEGNGESEPRVRSKSKDKSNPSSDPSHHSRHRSSRERPKKRALQVPVEAGKKPRGRTSGPLAEFLFNAASPLPPRKSADAASDVSSLFTERRMYPGSNQRPRSSELPSAQRSRRPSRKSAPSSASHHFDALFQDF